jgi:pSer/pThr/pTyr-binding forkhead associated (FHA) protein
MVIIKKDDYISFLNSTTGVNKMPTPPNSVNSVSTIKRDNSQEQLQKLQQYAQQQTSAVDNKSAAPLARAVLVCRPNSHPFSTRTLSLEPNKIVKIGRAIARTKACDANAIFDCKVLSRNHAELWYNDGKFFIKDTGSSNGTFVNNQRLSQTTHQSEPYEVSSGDIVQFGVDVMENSRKETHGCIVATLKLYLPDGRETKASQSTMVGPINTKIPQVDLYRLNQYIQEAVQREQILETKLVNVQKKIDLVR